MRRTGGHRVDEAFRFVSNLVADDLYLHNRQLLVGSRL